MWRFFRIGIKGPNFSENCQHFRIIGTASTKAECEDRCDEAENEVLNKENSEKLINLASEATKKFKSASDNNFQNDFSIRGLIPKGVLSKDQISEFSKNIQIEKKKSLYQDKKDLGGISGALTTKSDLQDNTVNNFVNDRHVDTLKDISPKFEINLKVDKTIHNFNKDTNKFKNSRHENEIFGNLKLKIIKDSQDLNNLLDDDDDSLKPSNDNYDRKLDPQLYGRKILALCKENKLQEGLDVLQMEMRNLNIVPNPYCYNILINACSKVGATDKAFELYYDMKSRGIMVQKFALTGLFNACGQPPTPSNLNHNKKSRVRIQSLSDRLQMAHNLRDSLKKSGTVLHPITYHAMIKAFGRCKDIETAFEIADEMLSNNVIVTYETINFLLQACVSDRQTGFRNCLMVWRRMRSLGLVPSIHSYNLLLRCVKECSSGVLPEDFLNILQNMEFLSKKEMKKYKKLPIKKPADNKKLIPAKFSTNLNGKIEINRDKNVVIDGRILIDEKENINKSQNMNVNDSENPVSNTQEFSSKESLKTSSVNEIEHDHSKMNMNENESDPEKLNVELVEKFSSNLPQNLPLDLLAKKFSQGNLESVEELSKSSDRLLFLGGLEGILKNMDKDGVKPNCSIFTYLLESLPSDDDLTYTFDNENNSFTESNLKGENKNPKSVKNSHLSSSQSKNYEDILLSVMESRQVAPDIIFCNKLIQRRCSNRQLEKAKDVLSIMQNHRITPDLATFGCLAIGCSRNDDVQTLLKDMEQSGHRPNETIMGTLLRNCVRDRHYTTAVELLRKTQQYGIASPSMRFIDNLERSRTITKERMMEMEKKKDVLSRYEKSKIDQMKLFLMEYNSWLRRTTWNANEAKDEFNTQRQLREFNS